MVKNPRGHKGAAARWSKIFLTCRYSRTPNEHRRGTLVSQGRARAHRALATSTEALSRSSQGANGGAWQNTHSAGRLLEGPQAADPKQSLHSWLPTPRDERSQTRP